VPRYRITVASPKSLLRKRKELSKIVEAADLEEAKRKAHEMRQRLFFEIGLSVSWTVSVEELVE